MDFRFIRNTDNDGGGELEFESHLNEEKEEIWDKEYSWRAHKGTVCSILFYRELNILCSCSYDNSVCIWKLKNAGEDDAPELLVRYEKELGGKDVNCMKKWDDRSFICGTDLGNVVAVSVDPVGILKDFNIRAIGREDNTLVVHCVRLSFPHGDYQSGELFAVLGSNNGKCQVVIVEYSTGKALYSRTTFLGVDTQPISVASYSDMVESLTIPNSLIVNTGRGSSEDLGVRVQMVDYVSAEVTRRYGQGKNIWNIYAIDNFINKQNREIMIAGGSDDIVYCYDVETTLLIKLFCTTGSCSCFKRLGVSHLLVGESQQRIELFDFSKVMDSSLLSPEEVAKKVTLPPGQKLFSGVIQNLKIESTEKSLYSTRFGKSFHFLESFALLTDLSRGGEYMNPSIDEHNEVGDIRVAVSGADGKILIFSLKNVRVVPEDSTDQQNLLDLMERIQYLLYDESRYVGEKENRRIQFIGGGNVVVEHEILRLFL